MLANRPSSSFPSCRSKHDGQRRSWLFVAALAALPACARAEPRSSPGPEPGEARRSTTLTHLGVAGWKLESPSGTLLFDPYVTRANVEDDAAPLVSDEAAIDASIPRRADVVLVGHSHYDHVLDVPSIARRTGATVIGTESTRNLVHAAGLAGDRVRVARGSETFDIGPFSIRPVRALHSLTGVENKEIPSTVSLPLPAGAYDEGGTLQYLVRFEGRTFFFVGTANFIEDEVRALGVRPDVAVVAVGLRNKVPDYTCRLLRALGLPKTVLPNHFDEFWKPLTPGKIELDAKTRADLDAFAAEVKSCAPDTNVHVPVHLERIDIR